MATGSSAFASHSRRNADMPGSMSISRYESGRASLPLPAVGTRCTQMVRPCRKDRSSCSVRVSSLAMCSMLMTF